MSQLFFEPRYRPLSATGGVYAGAQLYSYATETTTLQDTWSDAELDDENTNPIVADDAGLFGPIYLDETLEYKFVLKDANGVTIWTIDPYNAALSAAAIGGALYPQSPTELAGGVTPVEDSYEYGHARRYGLIGNGSDESQAFADFLTACAGAPYKAYLPRADVTKYVVGGNNAIPSNLHIECEQGVIVEANSSLGLTDVLLQFEGASNVVMDCHGAIFRMVRADYGSGEHRHIFNLKSCSHITINDPVANDGGGDGYYISGATDLVLHNIKTDNCRRQGVTFIKATGVRGTGIWRSTGSTGTAPNYGVDFEPNGPTDELIDIDIECIETADNDGVGVGFFLDDYQSGTPPDVSVSIGRIISRGNASNALRVRHVYLNAGSFGGYINVGHVVSEGDGAAAIYIEDKSVNAPRLNIGGYTIRNPCTGASAFSSTAAIYLGDTSAAVSGGINIGPGSISATHTDMDYGVILEMGGGYTDVRIELANVVGYQVSPVRWNNISAAIAEASTAMVDVSKLLDTVALTTGTNILATTHSGRVITNAGAAGLITLPLREYLPRGNSYRFRVEAAQSMVIDTFDAADRISGTTGAGQTVTSNVIGASAEVQYLGTLGGVRHWQFIPLCNPASWTFA